MHATRPCMCFVSCVFVCFSVTLSAHHQTLQHVSQTALGEASWRLGLKKGPKYRKAQNAPDGTWASNTKTSAKVLVMAVGAGAEWRLHRARPARTLQRTEPGAGVSKSVHEV